MYNKTSFPACNSQFWLMGLRFQLFSWGWEVYDTNEVSSDVCFLAPIIKIEGVDPLINGIIFFAFFLISRSLHITKHILIFFFCQISDDSSEAISDQTISNRFLTRFFGPHGITHKHDSITQVCLIKINVSFIWKKNPKSQNLSHWR